MKLLPPADRDRLELLLRLLGVAARPLEVLALGALHTRRRLLVERAADEAEREAEDARDGGVLVPYEYIDLQCKGRDDVGAFGRASRPHRSLQSGPPSGPVARPECVAQPGGLDVKLESQPDGGQG